MTACIAAAASGRHYGVEKTSGYCATTRTNGKRDTKQTAPPFCEYGRRRMYGHYDSWKCPTCQRKNWKKVNQEFAYCKHCGDRAKVFEGERLCS